MSRLFSKRPSANLLILYYCLLKKDFPARKDGMETTRAWRYWTMDQKLGNKEKLTFYDLFIGNLTFDTPLHVGSSEIALHTDAPLLRDAADRFYLPGTSIVGPLRARAMERFKANKALIDKIFGFQNDDDGSRSRLLLEDAYPCEQGGMTPDRAIPTTIRDGVAIDRTLESASSGAKYDLEITPAGTKFRLVTRLELREGDEVEEMRFLIQTVFRDFRDGKIRLGGSKTRGLGHCRFDYTAWQLDFSDKSALRTWLLNKNKVFDTPQEAGLSQLSGISNHGSDIEEEHDLDIEIGLSIGENSPFIIKHGKEDDDHDAIFTRVFDATGKDVDYIPGSSLKGVFRARAEKILRTLGGKACATIGENGCTRKIRKLIEKKEFNEGDAKKIVGNSCLVCRLFGNGYLAGRISFDDAFFEGELLKKQFDSVAIDRFTGGAMDGKLFDTLPVISGKTKVHISIKRPSNFDRALLLFLLRDLKEGFPPLRFGYGKSKGYGLFTCNSIAINGNILNGQGFRNIMEPFPEVKGWWKEEDNGQ